MSILKKAIFKFDLYCKELEGGVLKPKKYSIEIPIIAAPDDFFNLFENSPDILNDICKKYGYKRECVSLGTLDCYIEEEDTVVYLGIESILIDCKYFKDIYNDLKDVLDKNGFLNKSLITTEIVKKTSEERKFYFQVYFTYDLIDDEGYEIEDSAGNPIMETFFRRVPLKVTEKQFEDETEDCWDEISDIEDKYGVLDISGTVGLYFGLESYEISPEQFDDAFNDLKEFLKKNSFSN